MKNGGNVGMKSMYVSDVYNVTQISKGNNVPWEKLSKIAEEEEGDILFDFDGIELEEPWSNLTFKKLMKNEKVHMKVYSSEKLKDTINLMCLMANYKPNRVINEDIMVPTPVSAQDKRIMALAERFKNEINISQGTGVINVCNVVDQLGSTTTVDALEMALLDFAKTSGVKSFEVDTESIFIQINIIERLAALIGTMMDKGIELKILSDDDDTAGCIQTYQCVAGTSKLTAQERVKLFRDNIEPNTVGMLSRFKETKGKDAFGRCGNGVPIVCRPAIFRGIEKKEGKYYLKFTEFNGNYFFTKLHYKLENDMEEHPGLVKVEVSIPIFDVGLCNLFVGSMYHFNMPVQYSDKDYIYSYSECGSDVVELKRTIPEHIKSVLDDFGIKYNEMPLIHAIGETLRLLQKSKEQGK